jgi:hypothetical protein
VAVSVTARLHRIAASRAIQPHRTGHAVLQRIAGDRMADRHLLQIGQRGHQRRQVVARQVVAGIEPDARRRGRPPGLDHVGQRALLRRFIRRGPIQPGVDLDPVGPHFRRQLRRAGSGSMNTDTRMPADFSLAITSVR